MCLTPTCKVILHIWNSKLGLSDISLPFMTTWTLFSSRPHFSEALTLPPKLVNFLLVNFFLWLVYLGYIGWRTCSFLTVNTSRILIYTWWSLCQKSLPRTSIVGESDGLKKVLPSLMNCLFIMCLTLKTVHIICCKIRDLPTSFSFNFGSRFHQYLCHLSTLIV